MIIFLYGPDSFRSKQKLDEIINHYKNSQKSGLNFVILNANETDFADFYNIFKVSSMFAEKKLIILKNVFLNKKFQEDFLKEIKKLKELKDVILVYEGDSVDERIKIFKSLLLEAKSQEFILLESKALKNWAQKEFEKNNQKIHPVKSGEAGAMPIAQQFNRVNADALDILLIFVGNDLWRLSNEIKKLSDFRKDLVVRKEDVQLQVNPKIENDIFKTIDALGQKNKKQAMLFLKKHIDSGESPLYLLSMVAYEFKNLLIVKELAEKGLMYASIVKKSGLHPFVVKKNYFMCQQFSFDQLKKIYYRIFTIDVKIKTGQIEPETALDLLFSQI